MREAASEGLLVRKKAVQSRNLDQGRRWEKPRRREEVRLGWRCVIGNNLGLFLAVLHWRLGISSSCNGGVDGVLVALVVVMKLTEMFLL